MTKPESITLLVRGQGSQDAATIVASVRDYATHGFGIDTPYLKTLLERIPLSKEQLDNTVASLKVGYKNKIRRDDEVGAQAYLRAIEITQSFK